LDREGQLFQLASRLDKPDRAAIEERAGLQQRLAHAGLVHGSLRDFIDAEEHYANIAKDAQ